MEIITDVYRWFMSGICIAGVIAALFYWYAVSVDLKQTNDFDKKYRESRLDKDVYRKDRW